MTYLRAFPDRILKRYELRETGSASKILESIQPDAFADIVDVLSAFTLTSQLLLTKGGNRGRIPMIIDGAFESRGWLEARIDLYRRAFRFPGANAPDVHDDPFGKDAEEHLVSATCQRGYAVDNVKDRVALDVEWNPKDGNLDRDFSAYRAWHAEGLIDAAVLITRMHNETHDITNKAWRQYVSSHPERRSVKQPVTFNTTTTANFEKALTRVTRGDVGSCPILIVGIGKRTWDGKPWDGRIVEYDRNAEEYYLADFLGQPDAREPYNPL